MFGWLLKFFVFPFFGLSEGRQLPIDVVGFMKNSFFIAGFFMGLFSSPINVDKPFESILLKSLEFELLASFYLL